MDKEPVDYPYNGILFSNNKEWTKLCVCVCVSSSVLSDSLQPQWTVPCQAPLSVDSPGKYTEVGSHSLLQRTFSTQGSNPRLEAHTNVPSFFYKGAQAIQWRKDTFPKKKKMMLEQLDIQCCCCSVTKLYLTLCNLMDCSMPSFPVLHYLPEFAQTHVHRVGDAIQSSHPLSTSSPPALNLSQHHSFFPMNQLFALGDQSIGASASASVLTINIQDWFPSGWTWFDLLAVQGTLKSLLQNHNSKALILWC